jgi:hypothetical protein
MSEIYQKSDCFAAFAGASAKYLGEREGVLAKKSGDEWQKERFTMHASLCGGGDLLKALESVASYLADRLLNMSNDSKYSKRGNEKRSYWLRGKIFKYSKYKAWNEGIVTCRVSPSNTSRECARCGGLIARFDAGKPAEGYTPGAPLVYCPQSQMHGNSDRNASLVIGKRLLARYQTHSQEKPPTPLHAERPVKTGGVRRSQDAKGFGRPSPNLAGHGRANAQDTLNGMVESVSGIVRQLRVFTES